MKVGKALVKSPTPEDKINRGVTLEYDVVRVPPRGTQPAAMPDTVDHRSAARHTHPFTGPESSML